MNEKEEILQYLKEYDTKHNTQYFADIVEYDYDVCRMSCQRNIIIKKPNGMSYVQSIHPTIQLTYEYVEVILAPDLINMFNGIIEPFVCSINFKEDKNEH